MKEWYFYDSAGTRRKVVQPYIYDASGDRRKVTAGYFYDSAGDRRHFFQSGGGAGQIMYASTSSSESLPIKFMVPDGVTELQVACIGGGGGGSYLTAAPGAQGGGGGGMAWGRLTVTPGQTYHIVPGYGGLGATTNGGAGQPGSSSRFQSTDGIPLVYFQGGGGGPNLGGGGLINSPATGTTQSGGQGGTGSLTINHGGGGGGAGYTGPGGRGGSGSAGAGTAGQGGGGGGGNGYTANGVGGGGGGTLPHGQGQSGSGGSGSGIGGGGGSGGTSGQQGLATGGGGRGGRFGGGGGGRGLVPGTTPQGGPGAVYVRWGGNALPAPAEWIPYEDDFIGRPGPDIGGVSSFGRGVANTDCTPFFPAVRNGITLTSVLASANNNTYSIVLDGFTSDPLPIANVIANHLAGIQVGAVTLMLINAANSYYDQNLGMLSLLGIPGTYWAPGTPVTCRFIY